MTKHYVLIALLVSSFSTTADVVEEVVVTASMAEGSYDMPAVTLTRNADFIVQSIRLVNDSRAPDLRRTEILQTISKMLRSAQRKKGIELSYGTGFLVPIDLDDDSLELLNDRSRINTSYIDLYAKVAVEPESDLRKQIADLNQFIDGQQVEGRTEVEKRGDVGVSIVNPQQYRYDILKLIAEENQRVIEAMGGDCEITVGGLEGRIEWERSSVNELTLYIPYGTEVECN